MATLPEPLLRPISHQQDERWRCHLDPRGDESAEAGRINGNKQPCPESVPEEPSNRIRCILPEPFVSLNQKAW